LKVIKAIIIIIIIDIRMLQRWLNDIIMLFLQMGARRQGMVYTHRSCENAHLPKIDPWITQRTLTGSVAAVVIEVWGCQPEVDVEGLLHEIIKLTRCSSAAVHASHTQFL